MHDSFPLGAKHKAFPRVLSHFLHMHSLRYFHSMYEPFFFVCTTLGVSPVWMSRFPYMDSRRCFSSIYKTFTLYGHAVGGYHLIQSQ